MKRLYIVLTILLSSFLLLSGREVKADVITFDISDSLFEEMNNVLPTLRSRVEAFLEEDNTYSDDYFIIYYPNFPSSQRYSVVVTKKGKRSYVVFSYNKKYSFPQISLSCINFIYSYYDPSNFTSFSFNSSPNSSYTFSSPNFAPIYSSFPLSLADSVESVVFNYNGETYSVSPPDNFPTLYNLYEHFNSVPPEPVDNTPQLTTFYTFVLAKIAYFCNYMATNTLFLTMFVIIILIFIFELIFRRRL